MLEYFFGWGLSMALTRLFMVLLLIVCVYKFIVYMHNRRQDYYKWERIDKFKTYLVAVIGSILTASLLFFSSYTEKKAIDYKPDMSYERPVVDTTIKPLPPRTEKLDGFQFKK